MTRRLLFICALALSVGSTALADNRGNQGGGGNRGGGGNNSGGNHRGAPEPSTLVVLGLGAAGVAAAVWRGRRGK